MMTSEPIANYALLSDCRSAALVSVSGSVDWLCFPRFDSPSAFARILGAEAGHWAVRPLGESSVTRRYVDSTMVLETVHTQAQGVAVVTDALVLGDGRRGHDLGADVPGTLVRQVHCSSGEVEIEVVFAPRPGYAVDPPRLVADGAPAPGRAGRRRPVPGRHAPGRQRGAGPLWRPGRWRSRGTSGGAASGFRRGTGSASPCSTWTRPATRRRPGPRKKSAAVLTIPGTAGPAGPRCTRVTRGRGRTWSA